MGRRLCHRCLKFARPEAHYCATCGCILPGHQPPPPIKTECRQGTIVPWMVLIGAIIVTLRPQAAPHPTLIDSSSGRRATGLIIDFPPEYPATFFGSQALPGD